MPSELLLACTDLCHHSAYPDVKIVQNLRINYMIFKSVFMIHEASSPQCPLDS